MFKKIEFYDEIYGIQHVILIGDPKRSEKYVKKEYKLKLDLDERLAGRNVYRGGYSIIWLKSLEQKIEDFAILIHEISHASVHILTDRGIKIKLSSNEPLAYYEAYITKSILSKLEQKIKK